MFGFFELSSTPARMTRLTNTIRLHALSKTPEEREQIHELLKQIIGERLQKVDYETLGDDTRVNKTYEPLYAINVRLYSQPEQRAFIQYLREHLPEEDKEQLTSDVNKHLDEHLDLYFRIDKQGFLQEKPRYVLKGDVIQVRVNLCAHPKNPQTTLKQAKKLLA